MIPSSTSKKPKPGDLVIDASDITVTDISPHDIQALNRPPDEYAKAVASLAALKPEEIERAGLTPRAVQRVLHLQKDDERIGELLPAAERMVTMLNEARLIRRHEIATLLTELAAQARRAEQAESSAEALGPLADLLEYPAAPVSSPPTRPQGTAARSSRTVTVEVITRTTS
jgi:hypothetical protein